MPFGHRLTSHDQGSEERRSRSNYTKNVLPQRLQNSAPSCAQSCISTYIEQDCSCAANDLSCLCSQYSSDGLTLGEQALICLHLNCPNSSNDEALAMYNVCDAEPNAVPATHQQLTIPATNPVVTTICDYNTPPPLPTTTLLSQRTITTHAPQITSFATSASTEPSPTMAPATISATISATATSTSTATRPTSLTTGQAVGVAVGVICAVFIAIGLAWIFTCLKRRKAARRRSERHSYDFVDNAPPRFLSSEQGSADPGATSGGFIIPPLRPPPGDRRTQWPSHVREMSQYHHPQNATHLPHDVRQHQSRHVDQSDSPDSQESDCSTRTVSQLLPDKPTAASLRSPPKTANNLLAPTYVDKEQCSPARNANVPTGLFASTMSTQKPLQPRLGPPPRIQQHRRQVPLSLDIPKQPSRTALQHDVRMFNAPLPDTLKQTTPTDSPLSGRSRDRSSDTSLLNYYASADAQSPEVYETTPIDDVTQIRRPPPAFIMVTKPTFPPRAIRASGTSDHSNRTSFESTDPDEPTPPQEEEKHLSPVAESPIAKLRYPKIPRSSNQVVPRSPTYISPPRQPARERHPHDGYDHHPAVTHSSRSVARTNQGSSPTRTAPRSLTTAKPETPDCDASHRHTPSLSGSTLATRRRHDSFTKDIERGLGIEKTNDLRMNSQKSPDYGHADYAHPQRQLKYESPIKVYGGVTTSAQRQPPHWPLTLQLNHEMRSPPSVKSPLWEPKLTPRREGEDLYLDLSLATPHQSQFHHRI